MTGLEAATHVYLEVCQGGQAAPRLAAFLAEHDRWLSDRGGKATAEEHVRHAVGVIVDDVRTVAM